MDWLLTDGPNWAAFIAALLPPYIYGLWTTTDRRRTLDRAEAAEDLADRALDTASEASHWCQQVHDALQPPQRPVDAMTTGYRPDDTNPITTGRPTGAQRVATNPQPVFHGATRAGHGDLAQFRFRQETQ